MLYFCSYKREKPKLFLSMNLMRRIVFVIFAVLSSISCIKAEKVTVTVTNAGELSHAIESVQETAITNLTIKGKLGGTDLAYIRTMKGKISSLEELDLKDVTLVDDGEPYYHYSFRSDAVWYTNHIRYFISKERKHVKWSDNMTQAGNLYDDYYDYNLAGAFQGMLLRRIVLPSSLNEIGQDEFKKCTKLVEIVMGSKPVFVGANACEECTSLERIPELDNVIEMKEHAFRNCAVLNPDIGLSLQQLDSIPAYAFEGCRMLAEVTLSSTLQHVDQMAFYNSGIKKLKLPNDYTQYGSKAFASCSNLIDVDVPKNLCRIPYDLFMGCPWYQNPSRVVGGVRFVGNIGTEIDQNAPKLYFKDSAVGVADNFNGNGTDEKSKDSPVEINLTPTIRYIGTCAFKDMEIQKITLTNVEEIGDYAFCDCTNLEEATLSTSLKKIGKESFRNCKLKEVTIAESVKDVGDAAFMSNTALQKVIYQADSISGKSVFSTCTSLTDLEIGPKVRCISQAMFYGCVNLREIVIPESVKTIDNHAFEGCTNTRKLVVGDGVERIVAQAFYKTDSLEEIVYLPDATVPLNLFACHPKLECVTIGPKVRNLGSSPFADCPNIRRVNFEAENLETKYMFASAQIEQIVFGSSVKIIPEATFENCICLKGLELPESLIEVGNMAFQGCDSIKKLSIGRQLQTVGWHAFYCMGLEEVYYNAANLISVSRVDGIFPGHPKVHTIVCGPDVQSLPSRVFRDLDSLYTLTFGDNIETIQSSSVYECPRLKNICIGKNTKRVELLFEGCDSLQNLYYNAICMEKFNQPFDLRGQLTNVIFGPDVREIPEDAFIGSYKLKHIVLNEGLEIIGGCAFYNCPELEDVTIPSSVKTIKYLAFAECPNIKRVASCYVQSPTPFGKDVFDETTYASAKLYVPVGTVEMHKNTLGWMNFYDIIEDDSIIDALDGKTSITRLDSVYSIEGYMTDLKSGLNIIRMSDGTARKVIIK